LGIRALIILKFNNFSQTKPLTLKNPPVFKKIKAAIFQSAFGTAFACQGAKM
jgi:hypothetical protein